MKVFSIRLPKQIVEDLPTMDFSFSDLVRIAIKLLLAEKEENELWSDYFRRLKKKYKI